ncbi:GGDEF domain-containing protein [Marinospirillum alkaliphilum]|uniref:diguanylate cyclase n=1 Tax=Marinospirillum alkaliphilum DSM 21637 TaxID=1122209 RepID=A0A1K1U974_9GAMM|nr:GGDEF domain-containing protein [Marinospirillum alkaliphilum]SFX09390.1 diguanylate cyclase (GGDEF) domain-containing protein [Marinospirillum alkaliphilum DSM 21637]
MELQQQTINPRTTLFSFRNRVTFNVQLWTLLALLPMIAVQFYQQHHGLALMMLAFAIFLAYNLRVGRQQALQHWQAKGFVLFASVCVIYSTWLNGHQGIYWAFPVMASYFFMLHSTQAGKAALAFMACLTPVILHSFPWQEAIRVLLALGLTTLFINFFADIVVRLHRDLVKLGTCDPLTGCLNRSQLQDSLAAALQQHKQQQTPYSLLLLDLDHFKEVNDRYGHHQGDVLLVEFAELIRQHITKSDRLFRLGGEEFLVLLDQQDQRAAMQTAEGLLQTIRTHTFSNGLKITTSAGLAQAHSEYQDWSLWLHQADEVLYQAKHAGRDSYRVAD